MKQIVQLITPIKSAHTYTHHININIILRFYYFFFLLTAKREEKKWQETKRGVCFIYDAQVSSSS